MNIDFQRAAAGSSSFRDDQRQRRRLVRVATTVGWVFCALMTQVWLSTEVKQRQARVEQLEAEIGRLKVDESTLSGRMQKESTYSELLAVAEDLGLSAEGARQRVALPPSAGTPEIVAEVEPMQAGVLPTFGLARRSNPEPNGSSGDGKGR
ncbi:MAG: hypothetical protein IT349_18560 [Candidatus Eisenbacteria bacterium]|nr:hypothetical protein [Candidatus Eisenbacteria bacterium]MCC7144103.1 hypothetical protein [Candidatus Eisenbacteria bacterium]